MQKRRSLVADEIMRDYFRDLRWKQRIEEMKQQKEEQNNNKINNTR